VRLLGRCWAGRLVRRTQPWQITSWPPYKGRPRLSLASIRWRIARGCPEVSAGVARAGSCQHMVGATPVGLKLVADALSQGYGDLVLFQGLTFSVPQGRALVVTGDNGTGKSTLLRTLAGLMQPASGEARLEGGDREVPLAEQCHLVGYQNALKGELTATETLTQWRDILGAGPDAHSIDAALECLGLESFANTPAGFLSTGLKRRLALARILVAQRPVWFLDEPTAALDHASCKLVAEMIQEHLAHGGIAVIATHLDLGIDGLDALELKSQVAAS
jgi:heme exporter protein A